MKLGIGEKIKKFREELGLSQKKLGLALGLSDKAISAYESDRTYPPIDTLYRIAQELDKPITAFITEDIEVDKKIRLQNIENLLNDIKLQVEDLRDSL